MKRYKFCILVGIALLLAKGAVFAEGFGVAEFRHMAEGLRNKPMSMSRFLGYLESNKCDVGPINSLWYATNITTRSFDQTPIFAAREFGGALFLRMEGWATEMKAEKPAAEPIRQFMNLADWLMKSPGYGNFFMARRCHEIAMHEIARSLVNTNCPVGGITNLFSRFDTPWKRPAGRAKILNDDVGAQLFDVPSGDEKTQQQYLDRMWTVGKTMVLKYSTPEMQAAFEGHPPKGMEDVSEMVRRWYLGAYETPFMREHVSFFKDDGKVSSKNWNANDHESLIVAYQEPQLPRLKCLAEFRAAIGNFPGEYVANEAPATSKQRAAFVQAWTEYRKQKGLPVDDGVAVTAWEVYRDIMAGTFPG